MEERHKNTEWVPSKVQQHRVKLRIPTPFIIKMERIIKTETGNVMVEHRWDKKDKWIVIRRAEIEELLFEILKELKKWKIK